MHGLMRVRGFTQDDAHIFCSEDQIEAETAGFIGLLASIYKDLGFERFDIKLSTRPAVRVGSDAIWDKSEAALEAAVRKVTDEFVIDPGEGAFYGPKLDFKLTDAIGREWQCGTFQVDFNMPNRLGAEFVMPSGEKAVPVMLHRAILGSFERFMGILIENHAGRFPLWLAPRQVVVATIVSDADGYAGEVAAKLRNAGLRVDVDSRNEKINYKVREHSNAHIPAIVAVGRQEVEAGTVAVRRLGQQGQRVVGLDEAIAALAAEATPPDCQRN
jgi:threonyl-tRNA synthetase